MNRDSDPPTGYTPDWRRGGPQRELLVVRSRTQCVRCVVPELWAGGGNGGSAPRQRSPGCGPHIVPRLIPASV